MKGRPHFSTLKRRADLQTRAHVQGSGKKLKITSKLVTETSLFADQTFTIMYMTNITYELRWTSVYQISVHLQKGFDNPLPPLLIKTQATITPGLLSNAMPYYSLLKIYNKGISCLLVMLTNPTIFTGIQNAWKGAQKAKQIGQVQ